MNPFRILIRNIKDGVKSVFRNFSLSLASISCITITLILVGVSIILSANVNNFTKEIEKDVTIVVFLDKKISDEKINQISSSIKSMKNVENVDFESKNDIKKEMQDTSEVFDSIMNEWDSKTNPLQDTFSVKVKDINKIGQTAHSIKNINGVDVVKYGEGMVENLVGIFDGVKKVTIAVVIGLILVTAFLISNTIKIAISSRKRQIEIMRLVGASNSYIKMPFFIEGIILGFFGAIIPVLGCCYGYVFFFNKFDGNLFTPIITLVTPDKLMLPLIIVIVAIGVSVGAIGSYRAVKKFLKI